MIIDNIKSTCSRTLAAFSRIRDNVTSGGIENHIWGFGGINDPYYLYRLNQFQSWISQIIFRMLNTKFGIHFRGDTITSNRLYEWVEVEALLIMIAGKHSYLHILLI